MRIICPDCAARYELPQALAARLPGQVRCARCGREWDQEPASAIETAPKPASEPTSEQAVQPITDPTEFSPEPESKPALEPVAVPQGPRPVAANRLNSLAVARESVVREVEPSPAVVDYAPDGSRARDGEKLLWIASIAIIVLAIALAIGLRGAIIHAWPPSLRLYRALGLA